MTCIWCKKNDREPSVEHIIPEALGCPQGFVLTGGVVCRICNNGLAKLDRSVIDDFDFLIFMAGIPRKGGRPPAVMSRGNVMATFGQQGPQISFNMSKNAVQAHDGTMISPKGNSSRHIKATFSRSGSIGKVSFNTEIGRDPKFSRGIVKIAISSLAYFLGEDAALSEKLDNARNFVIDGIGNRKIIMLIEDDKNYYNHVSTPLTNDRGDYLITLRLAYVRFLVDLSPDLSVFPILQKTAYENYGKTGWTYLPIDEKK